MLITILTALALSITGPVIGLIAFIAFMWVAAFASKIHEVLGSLIGIVGTGFSVALAFAGVIKGVVMFVGALG